jgi:hypothetical protein
MQTEVVGEDEMMHCAICEWNVSNLDEIDSSIWEKTETCVKECVISAEKCHRSDSAQRQANETHNVQFVSLVLQW